MVSHRFAPPIYDPQDLGRDRDRVCKSVLRTMMGKTVEKPRGLRDIAARFEGGVDSWSKIAVPGLYELYESYLRELTDRPITLLELGVHGGASLKTFASYFPNGKIRMSSPYKDDLLHGEVKTFTEDGKLKQTVRYQEGKPVQAASSPPAKTKRL